MVADGCKSDDAATLSYVALCVILLETRLCLQGLATLWRE
jgi:hypothetical protein